MEKLKKFLLQHKNEKTYLLNLSKSKIQVCWASQAALVVKNPPADAGDLRDTDSILGLGRSLEGGHSNPLQYSCLETPMDRGAWGTDRKSVV